MAERVKENPETESDTTIAFGTAVLDNCLDSQNTRNHFDTLSMIIDHKENLQKNIEDFKFGNLPSRDLSNKRSKTVQLREYPREYLWRYLGSNNWTLNDGAVVYLPEVVIYFPFCFFQSAHVFVLRHLLMHNYT